jgi:DNA-binding NtrC family response regulator
MRRDQTVSSALRATGLPLPEVLVIDDELGRPELFRTVEGLAEQGRVTFAERRRICERFGLLDEGEEGEPVKDPVAKAVFIPALQWRYPGLAALDAESVFRRLRHLYYERQPGPALILLDLQFGYGTWQAHSREFSLVSTTFGADVLLPGIRERFGTDPSSPGARWSAIPVVILSSLPKEDVDEIVRTRGARGMLRKHGPETASECRQLLRSYIQAHGVIPDPRGILVGHSLGFLNVLAAARRSSGASSVLLLGESGTGKELLARYIHDHSPRATAPYRVFHAAGRSDDLQEDELFGHWSGAFTGAESDRPGLLEDASGGTLFIDEIGDVGPRVQNALMRPLQERVSFRIGRPPVRERASAGVPIDLLFVFATNKDLGELAELGSFKPDLLDRIEEVTVTLPSLRERPDDIPLLAKALLARIDEEVAGRGARGRTHRLDSKAKRLLAGMDFSRGNVRELRNRLLKAVLANPAEELLSAPDVAEPGDMPINGNGREAPTQDEDISPKWLVALSQWVRSSERSITLAQTEIFQETLRGAGPHAVVALLEASLVLCRHSGRAASLPAVMEHFWGCGKLSSQEAKRALVRLLQVEWQDGLVALEANKSGALCSEPRIRRLIADVLAKRRFGDDV